MCISDTKFDELLLLYLEHCRNLYYLCSCESSNTIAKAALDTD